MPRHVENCLGPEVGLGEIAIDVTQAHFWTVLERHDIHVSGEEAIKFGIADEISFPRFPGDSLTPTEKPM